MSAQMGTATRALVFPEPPAVPVMPPNGCGGWRDEDGRWHRCTTTEEKVYAQGRCTRCYSRQRRVVKQAEREARRDAPLLVAPDPAIGPADFGGEDAPHAPSVATVRAEIAQRSPEIPAPAPDEGYDWTLFDAPSGQLDSRRPIVTLGKDGDIRLNFGAFELAGSPAAIEVLHDERRRALALRGCDPGKAHARVLREDRKTRARQIAARPLRRLLPWVPAETVRITPRREGDLLILDLPR